MAWCSEHGCPDIVCDFKHINVTPAGRNYQTQGDGNPHTVSMAQIDKMKADLHESTGMSVDDMEVVQQGDYVTVRAIPK